MLTSWFKDCKERGRVRKVGTAWFRDGMRHCERALYFCEEDGGHYVILNRNVHPFKAYSVGQNVPGIIKGHICGW
jgi:hypothetical protein